MRSPVASLSIALLVAALIGGCTSPEDELEETVSAEAVPESFEEVEGDLGTLERFVHAEGFGAPHGTVPHSPGAVQQAATANARSNLAERLAGLSIGKGQTLRDLIGSDGADAFNELIDSAEVTGGGPLAGEGPVRHSLVRISLEQLAALFVGQPGARESLARSYDPKAFARRPIPAGPHRSWKALIDGWSPPASIGRRTATAVWTPSAPRVAWDAEAARPALPTRYVAADGAGTQVVIWLPRPLRRLEQIVETLPRGAKLTSHVARAGPRGCEATASLRLLSLSITGPGATCLVYRLAGAVTAEQLDGALQGPDGKPIAQIARGKGAPPSPTHADVAGPRFFLATPAPGTTVDTKEIVVAGAIHDASGVHEWRMGRSLARLRGQPANPKLPMVVPFRVVLPMRPGSNELYIGAADGAGNLSGIRIEVTR